MEDDGAPPMDDDMPKNPTVEVMGHIAFKGWQTGAIIGSLSAYPWIRFVHKTPASIGGVLRIAGNVATGFAFAVPAICAFKVVPDQGTYKNVDRAYRLKHSASQQRTDFFGTTGFCLFALGGIVLPSSLTLGLTFGQRVLGAGAYGTSAGILTHLLTSPSHEEDAQED